MAKKRMLIVMDGGVIHNIVSDEDVDVTVIDYDTDGIDDDELVALGNYDVYVTGREVEINPKEVDRILDIIEENNEEDEEEE